MNKVKVFWWIRGVGGHPRKQGQDIIETEIDFFDEADAEERIEKDLGAQVPERISGSTGRFSTFEVKADEDGYEPDFPNFIEAHKKIMNDNIRGTVSNWGVKKVKVVESNLKG